MLCNSIVVLLIQMEESCLLKYPYTSILHDSTTSFYCVFIKQHHIDVSGSYFSSVLVATPLSALKKDWNDLRLEKDCC
jgi:hypothetical protein